jgi:deoxyribonuclease V
LPGIRAVLSALSRPPDLVIVDGYVWLGNENQPGLGGHLFRELDAKVPVVGVAKTRYRGQRAALEITRGRSRTPLYITAAGIDVHEAAPCIQQMHGSHRIPTLLKRVDKLCRTWQPNLKH